MSLDKPRYSDFLQIVCDKRYNVIPVEGYDEAWRPDKVNILLRHDLDDDNGLGFMQLEWNCGIRSTFYVMANRSTVNNLWECKYNVADVAKFYKFFEGRGWRFGYHFKDVDEVLGSRANGSLKPDEVSADDRQRAIESFKMNLTNLRQWLIISSAASHGGCCNWFMDYSNGWPEEWTKLSSELGIFSAYRIPFSKNRLESGISYTQLSDLDNNIDFKTKGVSYYRDELEKLKAGDIVQILIHPFTPRWEYPTYDHIPPLHE